METRTLLRPLVWVAKHQLSFARTASTSNANTQRHLSTSQYSYASIPDFLLPSSVTKKHHASTISHRRRPLLQSAPASPGHPLQRRMFSASTTAKAAIVTANPRKDEYGNEMLIDITARAANVCSFHYSLPHHTTITKNGSSVLKKSCPRTPILILLYESQSSPAGATAFNILCLSPTHLQYLPKMIQYSSRAIFRGQRWLWTSQVWSC